MSLLDGLQLYFTLDETSGNCASSYGTALTGSCTNITYGTTGKIHKCYTFDSGSTSNVNFGNAGRYESFTVSAWVKTTNDISGTYAIITNYNTLIPEGWGATMDNGQWMMTVRNGDSPRACSLSHINDNSWHHLVATFDFVNMVELYTDGNYDVSWKIDSISSMVYNADDELIIGYAKGGNYGNYWDGDIDEVVIWDRVLSQEEITEVYNKGLAGKNIYENILNGLTAYYKLDEASGQVKDYSGNGHHSTEIVNITQNETGKIGKSVTINGNYGVPNYSYINLGHDPVFDFPSGLTISAWVYITMDATDDVIISKSYGGPNTVPYTFDITYSYMRFRTYNDTTGYVVVRTDNPIYSFWVNNWHHVAVTTNTNETKLFLDGQIVKTGVGLDIYGNRNSTDLLIGHYVAWTTYMYGKIDELMMWGRPLFPTEIEAVYNLGVSGQTLIRDKTKFVSGKKSGPGKLPSIVDLYGEDLISWKNFQVLINKSVDAGSVFSQTIVTTFSLIQTGVYSYWGTILSPNGDIHFIPGNTSVGQKINCYTGEVSTYSLVYTTNSNCYTGGVLNSKGEIHFIPQVSNYGQKISLSGVVSTYSLVDTNAYCGGVLDSNGDIHFIPYDTSNGQKVDISNNVSTYSLVYTTTNMYFGGSLAPNGDIHFVPYNAEVGQKIDINGTVSTYPLVYTTTNAYCGGVVNENGEIHFVPCSATVGQKIDINGTVSTYSLVYTTTLSYQGGVLSPNGDIHFVPNNANRGQKIDKYGIVSTYTTIGMALDLMGGSLSPNGEFYCAPYGSEFGVKISTTPTKPFSMAMCCSPHLNKL